MSARAQIHCVTITGNAVAAGADDGRLRVWRLRSFAAGSVEHRVPPPQACMGVAALHHARP